MIYGYIRVSTDKQTVENQRFEIRKYAKRKKIEIDVDDEGNKLKPNLSPTKQFNIIGDLLEAAGVLQEYKGQLWMEGKWENMNDSARRHEVQDWLKAYEKMEAKWWDETKPLFFPNSMIHLSGKKVLNQSQQAKIVQHGGRKFMESEIICPVFSR